jgi:hypothetical protein
LYLRRTGITDAGLKHLKNVQKLNLRRTQITDAGNT